MKKHALIEIRTRQGKSSHTTIRMREGKRVCFANLYSNVQSQQLAMFTHNTVIMICKLSVQFMDLVAYTCTAKACGECMHGLSLALWVDYYNMINDMTMMITC